MQEADGASSAIAAPGDLVLEGTEGEWTTAGVADEASAPDVVGPTAAGGDEEGEETVDTVAVKHLSGTGGEVSRRYLRPWLE